MTMKILLNTNMCMYIVKIVCFWKRKVVVMLVVEKELWESYHHGTIAVEARGLKIMIKKEEYVKFIQDLFYMCQNEDAKERTYRESFERHPNDFIKFGTIQNSMGKSDAYQKVFYRLKKFIEEGENDVECYCNKIGRTASRD